MDPPRVTAPKLKQSQIQRKVDEVRENYPAARVLPVNVEDLIDLDLDLDLQSVANLLHLAGTDALILPDWKTVLVDLAKFEDPKMTNRLRFSLAHELGHYFLHREVYSDLSFASVEDWIAFVVWIPDEVYGWLEYHADEFAGRLLVPEAELRESFRDTSNVLEGTKYAGRSDLPEPVADAIAKKICPRFGVSYKPIRSRMKRLGLWKPVYEAGDF
jgi:hypothetical protein